MAENKSQRRKNIFEGIRSCMKNAVVSLVEGSADLPDQDNDESLKPKIFFVHNVRDGKPLWAGSFYVSVIPVRREGVQTSLLQLGGDMGHFCLTGISLGFLVQNINNFGYFMDKIPPIFSEKVFVAHEVTEQLEDDYKEALDDLVNELQNHFRDLKKADPEAYWEPSDPYDQVILDILCGVDRYDLEDVLDSKDLGELDKLWKAKQSWAQEIQETDGDLQIEASFWENFASECGYSDCGYDLFYDYTDDTLRAYELLRVFVDLYTQTYLTQEEKETPWPVGSKVVFMGLGRREEGVIAHTYRDGAGDVRCKVLFFPCGVKEEMTKEESDQAYLLDYYQKSLVREGEGLL